MKMKIALTISPVGIKGYAMTEEIAPVIEVIKNSGLRYEFYSMFTEIEGESEEIYKLIKEASQTILDKGLGVEIHMKGDIPPQKN